MISGQAAFYGGDYLPYNDNVLVRILQGNVVLFYTNIATVGNFGSTPWTAWSYTLPANGTYTLEASSSNYGDCGVTSYLLLDSPHNNPPTADADGPYLVAVSSSIDFDGSGSSDPDGDPLTETWIADGGSVVGNTYTAGSEAGIFEVCLTVNDGIIDSAEACTIVVVYDPSAGFVTGGGWIESPAGAYMDDESLSGKATFGFVSKYKKGANVPTGNTEFQFKAAGFNFHSGTYEWLVVNQGGANAQFKGEGTVNGALDSNGNAFKFMLWAGDDSPDTFRIKIWSELDGVETVVYDNGFDQEIGGGSIVIHTKK
ncbi:MAG: PKD domain-containing protein [Anaerolineales bacterium]